MILKVNWEKTDEVITLDDTIIKAMVSDSLPEKNLLSYKIISGGCANLNIKLTFQETNEPLLLRVYLRDKDAAIKEQKLSALICKTIPVPKTIYVGNIRGYHYALVKYIEGKTLRDVIFDKNASDISEAIYEAGAMLAKIKNYKFSYSGFFDSNLYIEEKIEQESYVDYLEKCLKNPAIVKQLEKKTINLIKENTCKYSHLLPNGLEHNLVHADYDPSNILVQKKNGIWKIAAILDWEFAFSGSYLCDIANMLRYAHQLPKNYEKFFLKGIYDSGIELPSNWRITINLLNLISLLDCLARSDPKKRPNQCKDIHKLIEYILGELEQY
jgi:aminoglycoside phosphotransferase (APT) family kinase protein